MLKSELQRHMKRNARMIVEINREIEKLENELRKYRDMKYELVNELLDMQDDYNNMNYIEATHLDEVI